MKSLALWSLAWMVWVWNTSIAPAADEQAWLNVQDFKASGSEYETVAAELAPISTMCVAVSFH